MVSVDQIMDGFISFVEAEWFPALDETQQWMISAALSLAYQQKGSFLEGIGISAGEEGMVNIEPIIQAFKDTANKRGKLPIPIPNALTLLSKGLGIKLPGAKATEAFMLGEKDFDTLLEHIRKAGA